MVPMEPSIESYLADGSCGGGILGNKTIVRMGTMTKSRRMMTMTTTGYIHKKVSNELDLT